MEQTVALFTRAWIEIKDNSIYHIYAVVALFTRAWIEMSCSPKYVLCWLCRPLHEGVD